MIVHVRFICSSAIQRIFRRSMPPTPIGGGCHFGGNSKELERFPIIPIEKRSNLTESESRVLPEFATQLGLGDSFWQESLDESSGFGWE
jgi:hypothetical protein